MIVLPKFQAEISSLLQFLRVHLILTVQTKFFSCLRIFASGGNGALECIRKQQADLSISLYPFSTSVNWLNESVSLFRLGVPLASAYNYLWHLFRPFKWYWLNPHPVYHACNWVIHMLPAWVISGTLIDLCALANFPVLRINLSNRNRNTTLSDNYLKLVDSFSAKFDIN